MVFEHRASILVDDARVGGVDTVATWRHLLLDEPSRGLERVVLGHTFALFSAYVALRGYTPIESVEVDVQKVVRQGHGGLLALLVIGRSDVGLG